MPTATQPSPFRGGSTATASARVASPWGSAPTSFHVAPPDDEHPASATSPRTKARRIRGSAARGRTPGGSRCTGAPRRRRRAGRCGRSRPRRSPDAHRRMRDWIMPWHRSLSITISAPRNTPVSEAFFCMSGHTSRCACPRGRPRPTQLTRPRYASASMLPSSVLPPTGSTTRSTPRPSVSRRTSLGTSALA